MYTPQKCSTQNSLNFNELLARPVNYLPIMVHIQESELWFSFREPSAKMKGNKNKRSKGTGITVKEVDNTTRTHLVRSGLTNPFQFVCIDTIQDMWFREVSKIMDRIDFIGVRA